MSTSTSTSTSTSITLTPLRHPDIPTAAQICGSSMSSDRHTLLKASHPINPYNHAQGMLGAFEYWLSQPPADMQCTKAVDSLTGKMLGVVVWHFQLEDEEQPLPTNEGASEAKPEKPEILVSRDYTPADPEPGPEPVDALAALNDLTSAHLASYQRRIMPSGTKACVIGTLAVDPAAQGRGVGSALIRQGTDVADRAGAICWVHSSDGAEGVYAKAGFVVDEELVIDLDEWARKAGVGVGDEERGFGEYRFRYMVRQPR